MCCDSCHATVFACPNEASGVCNCYSTAADTLCRWCAYTEIIPNLSNPENIRRWAALETAKRQLLVQLESLGLPPFASDLQASHPLRFQFLEDSVDASGQVQKVTTGHEDGLIVINLAEADSVQRESTRIRLGEPQRTLIGHMRHEVGHYIDWTLASQVAFDDYRSLFGDPNVVNYEQAMQSHYANGAPNNWGDSFVSQYASMHPWEDFAETVNVYLDLMAIAATANDQGRTTLDLSPKSDLSQLVESILKIVVEVSEYNFDLGLQPLLPERFSPAVMDKLSYVHQLRSKKLDSVSQFN